MLRLQLRHTLAHAVQSFVSVNTDICKSLLHLVCTIPNLLVHKVIASDQCEGATVKERSYRRALFLWSLLRNLGSRDLGLGLFNYRFHRGFSSFYRRWHSFPCGRSSCNSFRFYHVYNGYLRK